jgi:glycosyltransferase involved in cell wall biosynthesis
MNSDKSLKIPLTAIILTKNEESAIRKCLDSVDFCDQVLVVDSNSVDRTVEISNLMGAEVVPFVWNNAYPKKKQWALQNPAIRNDWVIFLDADERVSQDLHNELRDLFRSNSLNRFVAIEIPLSYFFLGQELSFGHKVKKIALLNRRYCSFPVFDDLHVANMWEVEGHYQPSYSGKLLRVKSKIIHDDPDGLYDYFARHNRYSDWEAELRTNKSMAKHVRSNRTVQGRIFDRIPFKPLFFFIYSFVLKSGWRDGRAGLNYALALSFYYWQISVKSQERGQGAPVN